VPRRWVVVGSGNDGQVRGVQAVGVRAAMTGDRRSVAVMDRWWAAVWRGGGGVVSTAGGQRVVGGAGGVDGIGGGGEATVRSQGSHGGRVAGLRLRVILRLVGNAAGY
jgi:hypothetical protein